MKASNEEISPTENPCESCGTCPCECEELECPGTIEPDFYICEKCKKEVDIGEICDCKDDNLGIEEHKEFG